MAAALAQARAAHLDLVEVMKGTIIEGVCTILVVAGFAWG